MEELALSYCIKQKNIDNIIIGVDSISQLNANIKASTYEVSEEALKSINNIDVENLDLLNPSLWKLKTILITQARSGSTRLPGKILKEINVESLLRNSLKTFKKV